MNLSEMLDLPPDERRPYLHALPLTRTFVFGCMEGHDIRHIRRVLTRSGAVFREVYRFPGVYWVATFRDHEGRRRATEELVSWMNEALRESARLHGHLSEDEIADLLYTTDFAQTGDVPVFRFEKDIWIDHRQPQVITRHSHPIRG